MRKQAILLAATAAAAIFSSSSMAQPTFFATGYGGFVAGTASSSFPAPVTWWNSTTGTTTPTAGVIYTSISWGTPFPGPGGAAPFNGQSGVSINADGGSGPTAARALADPISNTISTSETPPNSAELGNLTHWNKPIDQWFGPDTVDIKYFKNIYSDAGHTDLLASLEGDFVLSVTETENKAVCDYPDPNSSKCDDFFTYTGGFTGDTTFIYDGVEYKVTTAGFYNGEGEFTGTFYSAEGSDNTGYVREVLTTPEPGTLALIGAGLLSAVAIRRRSKAA